ncbi:MAG: hypothetical protein GQ557_01190 [Mycoplasmataceae bacterium]|nr:hypothetical protein [Mycoplasmataceae bacterium]
MEKKERENKKNEKTKNIEKYLESLSDKELKRINSIFIEENRNNIVLRKHFKSGGFDIKNPSIKFNYYEFIFNRYIKK